MEAEKHATLDYRIAGGSGMANRKKFTNRIKKEFIDRYQLKCRPRFGTKLSE
jgi:hypothetical protein